MFCILRPLQTKTSVVASMLAAGYVLANDVLNKATEYDEKHNLSLQARVAVEQIKVKVHEFDQQHHISEKASQITSTAVEKAKQIDATYHVTEKAQQAAQTAKQTAESAAAKVITPSLIIISCCSTSCNMYFLFTYSRSVIIFQIQQNPTVSSVFQSVKNTASKVSQSVTATYQDYKEQTQKAIEEKQREKGAQQGSSAPAGTTTTTTETTTTETVTEGVAALATSETETTTPTTSTAAETTVDQTQQQ